MHKYYPQELKLFLLYFFLFVLEPFGLLVLFLPLFFSQKARSFCNCPSFLIIIAGISYAIIFCRTFIFTLFYFLGEKNDWKYDVFYRIQGITNRQGNYL